MKMINDKELIDANTSSNITQVVIETKARNKKKNTKNKINNEALIEVVSSEGIIFKEPSTIERNKDELKATLKDVSLNKNWV